jgi:exodeoxyribonuclease VII large subunit
VNDIRNIYTVTQVNSYLKNMFAQDFLLRLLSVKGEVSNCKYHSSGHIYFTLKDARGVIACVMFAGSRGGLRFPLQNGQQVVVSGSVEVYERDGKYQLYAKEITLDGAGQLYRRFEALKAELLEQGMFDAAYKQPIPRFIQTLGVITADTGAAVRDIIQITRRRNPYIQIILYPAIVQGERAVPSIVKGIRTLESMGVDVIILGRGGGSIEDLWAFNEREVAQAVFDSSVPIISAVGHETDTTIVDFVADLRAPTPSAAAELAVYDIEGLLHTLEALSRELTLLIDRKIRRQKEILLQYEMKLQLKSPQNRVREEKAYCMTLEERLERRMKELLIHKRHTLAIYIERMKGLSPLQRLEQGYAYVSTEEGKNVRSITGVIAGQPLRVRVTDGTIKTAVCGVEPLQDVEKSNF